MLMAAKRHKMRKKDNKTMLCSFATSVLLCGKIGSGLSPFSSVSISVHPW